MLSFFSCFRARKVYGNEIRVRTEEVRRAREDARIKAVEEEFKLRELERYLGSSSQCRLLGIKIFEFIIPLNACLRLSGDISI